MPDASEAGSRETDAKKPTILGVVFVHGIGSQRRGDTLVQVGQALHSWLSNWVKEWNVEVVDAKLTPDDLDAEAPPHARIVFRGGKTVSPYSWAIAESYWADCFPPPTYAQFVRWTLTVVPVAVLQHLTAQFRPALEVMKATRTLNELIPYEQPRLRKQLRANPDKGLSGVRARALLTSYSSWFVLPALLVGGLATQLVLILMLIPAALPIASIRSFARWIQLTLSATIGDSYLFVANPIAESAIVSKVQRDIEWLAKRCDQVVVVAHSQGAAVTYQAIQQWTWRSRVPDQLKLLITYGSGLRKLFELKSAARLTAWSERQLSTLLASLAMIASTLIAGLVVALFLGMVSFWVAASATVVLYAIVGGLLSVAAQEADARPSLLQVPWDDFYASHDPVSNGAIMVKDDSTDRPEPTRLPGSDPVIDFYLRQRDVVNRRSALSDHSSYWEGVDDFVARVVFRLFAVSGIPVHSLAPRWLDVTSDRRQWRVGLLSGCRAIAATAGVSVFLWISQTQGFLQHIGEWTLGRARSAPDWLGFPEGLGRLAAAVPHEWIGAASLGLAIAFVVWLLYAVGRAGWTLWDRQEHRQFFYMMGYHVSMTGLTIVGMIWVSLVAFPLAASALLASAGLVPTMSPWWIVAILFGVSVALVWKAGSPSGSAKVWASRNLAEGEGMLAGARGDIEQLREAAFRLAIGAVVLTRKKDVAARARAIQALATCLEQSISLDLREWERLAECSRKAVKRLAQKGVTPPPFRQCWTRRRHALPNSRTHCLRRPERRANRQRDE